MHKCGNHADKFQRLSPGIAELVQFVRRNVNRITRLKGLLLAIPKNGADAREHENLMFIVMLMPGRAAARRNDETPHGKVGAAVGRAAEELHFDVLCSLHGDGLGGKSGGVFEDHAGIKRKAEVKGKRD